MRIRLVLSGSLFPLLLPVGCNNDTMLSPDAGDVLLASASRTGFATPSNLIATADVAGRIDLAWQDNSDNEAGFEVRGSSDGPTGTFTLWTTTASNITNASFTGLGPSATYCFNVRAFTNKGMRSTYSVPSNTVCATTLPPPLPPGPNSPSGTVVTPVSSDRVLVTWVDNSDDEEWFDVEHAATSSGPWTVGARLGSRYTSYTAAGLPSEHQICYRVIATHAASASAPSNVDCTTPPAAPSGLAAIVADGPAIHLTWNDNSVAEDGYQVLRSSPGVASTAVQLPANTSTYRDLSVVVDRSYYYEVRAMKDGGYSSYSNFVAVATGVLKPPSRPGLDQPEGYYLGTMWLRWWNDPATVDSYQLERCDKETCADADFSLVATVADNGSSMAYMDWGLADWTLYTYRIRAVNKAGESEPSYPVQGRTCIEEVDWYSPCFPPVPGVQPTTSVSRSNGSPDSAPVTRGHSRLTRPERPQAKP